MCGRFVSASPPDEIAKYFGVDALGEKLLEADEYVPNHNVAPTTQILAVRDRVDDGDRSRHLDRLHWGLIPFWAKDPSIGNRMINARAETVAEKNSFKRPLQRRRCIIPVDGFYEWWAREGQKKKQPMYITRTDGDMFAFAGLWETWRGPDKDDSTYVESCTIITGAPNDKMAEIHHRMPIMLPPDRWDDWLDPELNDLEQLQSFFVSAPSELIRYHPVSLEVNNARNKGAHLADEVPLVDLD